MAAGCRGSYSLFAFRLFEHLREATSDDFVELAAFQAQNPHPMPVRRGGEGATSLHGQYVSANYFQMFGLRPAAGRLLRPEDDRPGAEPVVVISHRVWTQRFGQDPSLVGSSILVSGRPMTVAGVAAQEFFGDTVRPDPTALWIPLGQEPQLRGEASLIDHVNQDWLYAIGRLRPGVEPEQAATRATNALRQWLESQSFLSGEERARLPQQQVKVVSAGGGVPRLQAPSSQVLPILFVTSALVLLIATANLGNLLLARADRGQAAIRAALAASTRSPGDSPVQLAPAHPPCRPVQTAERIGVAHLDILGGWPYFTPRVSTTAEQERLELLQGTLDLLILRTLRLGSAHGHAIAKAIEHGSNDVLQV